MLIGRGENEFDRYPLFSDSEVEIEEIPKFQIFESPDREKLHEDMRNRKKKKNSTSLTSRTMKSKSEAMKNSEESEEELDIRERFYFSSKLYKFILQNAKRIKRFRLFMRIKREDIDKGFHKLNSYTKQKIKATEYAENLLLENPLGIEKKKVFNIFNNEENENESKIYQIPKKRWEIFLDRLS
jgi:hypothetical protein